MQTELLRSCVEKMLAQKPAASVDAKSSSSAHKIHQASMKFVGEILDAREWLVVQVQG